MSEASLKGIQIIASIRLEKSTKTLCERQHPLRSGRTATAIFEARQVARLHHRLSVTTTDRPCLASSDVYRRSHLIADARKAFEIAVNDALRL